MNKYTKLWLVLWKWRKEFTADEFISTFPSPDHNKILHDLAKKGFLKRAGWGSYRVVEPEEFFSSEFDITASYNLVKEAGMKYAFTGPDAVFFWTKGGYQADRFFGFYPVHIKVLKKDVRKWKFFFRKNRKQHYINKRPIRETFFGIFYVLYPEETFKAVKLNGYYVIPLTKTVSFCKEKVYTYEPALEMLDEMYNLGLKVKYREAKYL
jgi:hypothetical protein